MTFLGYPQGTKGYLFMRGPNNVLFIAVQALFDETLFPKCPDMRHPGYTPVAPVNAQDEYNIPPEDNENGDDGRHVPYQAPPPWPSPKNQGKGWNPNPPVLLEPTPPGLTRSESESDDFYVPKTPSLRSPSKDALDSSHRFFNPNPNPHGFDLYDQKQVFYENRADPSTPSRIRYNYTRHGRQLSWDWHNPTTEARYNSNCPIVEWHHHGGHADLDNTVFKEFL